ncbi:uncharacterized protein LOC129588581 [Paramacrobiotus metropolitanus]|uniref:uncharacterized protein LOC129588581 n=1 Tax=Paramacrobiotus metropolitanus TaxID=2943436 RepID=UPI002445B8C6|nr:uncharacterized protein LOC129588581 [Paramacrobiotus metropolitanus]
MDALEMTSTELDGSSPKTPNADEFSAAKKSEVTHDIHQARPDVHRGFFDKLTKDVADIYNDLIGSTPLLRTTTERADASLTQQLQEMERTTEDMLEKIVHYCEIIDKIRSDTSETLNLNLPRCYEIVKDLEVMYGRIDKLEHMLSTARTCTTAMEDTVVRAEEELMPTTSQSIKSFLRDISPFVLPKEDVSKWTFCHYAEPPLYMTKIPSPIDSEDKVQESEVYGL